MVGLPNFVRFVQGSAVTGDGLAGMARREVLADLGEHGLAVEERTGGQKSGIGRLCTLHRHMNANAGEHRPDMGRHVVGAFGAMYPAGVLRRQGPQRGAQIGLHVGVGRFPGSPLFHRN
jgi:hypothetical protein